MKNLIKMSGRDNSRMIKIMSQLFYDGVKKTKSVSYYSHLPAIKARTFRRGRKND
jgi:hypothetical protein